MSADALLHLLHALFYSVLGFVAGLVLCSIRSRAKGCCHRDQSH